MPPLPRGPVVFPALALCVALALPTAARGQSPTPDQQAAAILAAGQAAYNDGKPALAVEKFREFNQKFGGHRDANAARYGYGVALLDLRPTNYAKAVEKLTQPAGDGGFPDRPRALYFLGVAQRGLGRAEVAEGVARPNELPQRTAAANARFAEALKSFTQAREAFEKKSRPDPEWAARARCDEAEMELRLGKFKEARATTEPFFGDTGPATVAALGRYYHGVACFQLGDLPAAATALRALAPFDQPFGPHAQYLTGRIHAARGETAEAAAVFDAVAAGYDRRKRDAANALKQPERLQGSPREKARLEALANGPAPEAVAGSAFHRAALLDDAGKPGEALPRFRAVAQDFPRSALKDDAALRAAVCLVRLKRYDEAAKALQPLTNVSRLADQALYWTGTAQVAQAPAADPKNPAARTQALNAAVQSFRTAADRANQRVATDPGAKARRGDALLAAAEAHLANKQAREAAAAYDVVLNEKLLPARAADTHFRAAAAYHAAGDFGASDAKIASYQRQYPATVPLLILAAENDYARAGQLTKQGSAAAKRKFADAAQQYEEIVAKFPTADRMNHARYGLARCRVALGEWEQAAAALDAIPAPERTGELAAVPLLLADCLTRLAATSSSAAERTALRDRLGKVVGELGRFVAATPDAAEVADAILKIGNCQTRLGTSLLPENERAEALSQARAAYERVGRDFPRSPAAGPAALERAKILALQGDPTGAVAALRAFAAEPLVKSPTAPLAAITLAALLREQKKPDEAVRVIAEARQKFEGTLAADPHRKDWVPLLQYHHAVALAEAGKTAEARQAFDQVTYQGGTAPIIAEAALRAGQAAAADARKKAAAAETDAAGPGLTLDELTALEGQKRAARHDLQAAARSLQARAEQMKGRFPESETRARMLYEAAWALRAVGDDPEPAYSRLIAEFPAAPLAVEARLELAEWSIDQEKPADAVKLFTDALAVPPPPATADRIRLRLGGLLYDQKDYAAAQAHFETVAGNEASPDRAAARYRAAECLMARGEVAAARDRLTAFRDDPAFRAVPGVSDRAVLRLGHALVELKEWDAARQAFESLADQGDAALAADARYGAGWALQNAGRYDDAANQYAAVTQATTDDRAGRAHLQIGLCRAAQKRWADAGKAFAAVYFGFDQPALRFAAMVEHARALAEEKKTGEAAKLLERVVQDAPADGPWAPAATELLARIRK